MSVAQAPPDDVAEQGCAIEVSGSSASVGASRVEAGVLAIVAEHVRVSASMKAGGCGSTTLMAPTRTGQDASVPQREPGGTAAARRPLSSDAGAPAGVRGTPHVIAGARQPPTRLAHDQGGGVDEGLGVGEGERVPVEVAEADAVAEAVDDAVARGDVLEDDDVKRVGKAEGEGEDVAADE